MPQPLRRYRWGLLAVVVLGLLALRWLGTAADSEQMITLSVTLSEVLSLSVDGAQVTPITLSAAELAGALGNPAQTFRDLGSFEASILALTDFWVGVCYTASSNLPGSVTFNYDPLILTDANGALISGGAPPAPANQIDYLPDCGLSELDVLAFAPFFLGANNADTAGESFQFGLVLDLAGLGDRVAGEVLTFDVFFRVHDATL